MSKLNYTQSIERCAVIMSAVEGRNWRVQGKGLRDNCDWLALEHVQIITGYYLDHVVEKKSKPPEALGVSNG